MVTIGINYVRNVCVRMINMHAHILILLSIVMNPYSWLMRASLEQVYGLFIYRWIEELVKIMLFITFEMQYAHMCLNLGSNSLREG